MTSPQIERRAASSTALLCGVLLIAANLRAPITGLSPVLDSVRATFGLGTAAAGALTTLPLLAFALLSPFGAPIAKRYGLERALFGALVAIAAGIALRSAGVSWSLFVGTCVIGTGIAVGNVLLPSLVKRDFPQRVAAVTGAYALVMGIAAASGSAAAVPLARLWGWQAALASFAILPVVALAVWTTRLAARGEPTASAVAPQSGTRLWRSAIAWQVTLFLGLNATIYYVAIGWLPSILVAGGATPARAGSLHGILQLATAVPGLAIGPIVQRTRDQRWPAAVFASLSAIALLGFLTVPALAVVWSVLFGLGTGACIILGLAFIGLRTGDAREAAALSGMAQCLGYLLAAVGPMAMGALHDALGGWRVPLMVCVVLALGTVLTGILAGRDRRV